MKRHGLMVFVMFLATVLIGMSNVRANAQVNGCDSIFTKWALTTGTGLWGVASNIAAPSGTNMGYDATTQHYWGAASPTKDNNSSSYDGEIICSFYNGNSSSATATFSGTIEASGYADTGTCNSSTQQATGGSASVSGSSPSGLYDPTSPVTATVTVDAGQFSDYYNILMTGSASW